MASARVGSPRFWCQEPVANDTVAGDPRVESMIPPIGDGMTLARRPHDQES